MFKRFLLFSILTFTFISGFAQEDFDYVGIIKLNDTALISYKISFVEKDGLVKGHSITDLGGAHETKSFISGYFDDENNTLEFYESGILYTKSPVTQNDFCYVHFNGKLRKLNERQNIEGIFKGLYDDGTECLSGELMLANFGKVLKKAKKLDKKIDKSILVSQEKKDKVNLMRDLDSLSMNIIKKDEVLSVFSKNESIQLHLYDAGQEDGDKINVWINQEPILENFTVTTSNKILSIPLENTKTTIKVQALNNGSIGGNTVKIDIVDGANTIETLTSLKKGEVTQFVFLKNTK